MYISPYAGKTGTIDGVIRAKFPDLRSGRLKPIFRCFLFTGPAGCGKTDLAVRLANDLAGNPLNITFRIGTAVTVDEVRDWRRNAPYRSIFGGLTVRIMDEVDTVPKAGVTELREHMFFLPPWEVIFATTNLPVSQLHEPLQSRFKVEQFERVNTNQVAEWLVRQFPDVPADDLCEIARKSAGNVRAAEADADSMRDAIRYRYQQEEVAA